MRHNPYKIVKMFEETMADYCGSKYAVSLNSCTNAIFLSCLWVDVKNKDVIIPKQTYLSPPQSIQQAGGNLIFEEIDWKGIYQLKPHPIYDAAKRLTSGMYIPGTFMCLSFHIKKHLKIGKGGLILCDDAEAAKWFKARRYEGRTDGKKYHEDMIDEEGWNMYMTPEQAARGLTLMQNYPEHMPDIPEDPPYRDLTEFELFKNIPVLKK
jgi:dTDP-4-amino-4,6-dideoxygalactose transaminase|tara:strand:- start:441 stop:1067 length:627 start_codon:yes stop_codon:yes gene_type:complete